MESVNHFSAALLGDVRFALARSQGISLHQPSNSSNNNQQHQQHQQQHGLLALQQQNAPIRSGHGLNHHATSLQQQAAAVKASSSALATPEYTAKDILSGRGGLANRHSGNRVFRRLVDMNKPIYRELATKSQKTRLVDSILMAVAKKGGRFLKQDETTKQWMELEVKEAHHKTMQALREPDRKKSTAASSSEEASAMDASSNSSGCDQMRKPSPKKMVSSVPMTAGAAAAASLLQAPKAVSPYNEPGDGGDNSDDESIANLVDMVPLLRQLTGGTVVPPKAPQLKAALIAPPTATFNKRTSKMPSGFKRSTKSLMDDDDEEEQQAATALPPPSLRSLSHAQLAQARGFSSQAPFGLAPPQAPTAAAPYCPQMMLANAAMSLLPMSTQQPQEQVPEEAVPPPPLLQVSSSAFSPTPINESGLCLVRKQSLDLHQLIRAGDFLLQRQQQQDQQQQQQHLFMMQQQQQQPCAL